MPTSISRPASPRWTAVVTTRPSLAPPPAVIRLPLHLDLAEGQVGQPDDHARHALVAAPGCWSPGPAAALARLPRGSAGPARSVGRGSRGSAKYSAGPPSWNQVCIASGSPCRTIFSKPVKNPMTTPSVVIGGGKKGDSPHLCEAPGTVDRWSGRSGKWGLSPFSSTDRAVP